MLAFYSFVLVCARFTLAAVRNWHQEGNHYYCRLFFFFLQLRAIFSGVYFFGCLLSGHAMKRIDFARHSVIVGTHKTCSLKRERLNGQKLCRPFDLGVFAEYFVPWSDDVAACMGTNNKPIVLDSYRSAHPFSFRRAALCISVPIFCVSENTEQRRKVTGAANVSSYYSLFMGYLVGLYVHSL